MPVEARLARVREVPLLETAEEDGDEDEGLEGIEDEQRPVNADRDPGDAAVARPCRPMRWGCCWRGGCPGRSSATGDSAAGCAPGARWGNSARGTDRTPRR